MGHRKAPPNDANHLINRYYPEVRETITTAEALGVHLLTIHLWMDPRFVFPDIRKKKIEILQQLVPFSLDRGILLCLENLSESADVLTEILREVPHLALTLDIGHGQLLSETNTSFGIIERLTAAIQHVHIHDNRGGKGVKDDLHLPIGEGVIDFEQILGALLRKGYDRTVTLELHQDVLAASLKRVKDMIRRILNP